MEWNEEIKTMKDTMEMLQLTLSTHINGSGEGKHGFATETNHGFLSANDYKKFLEGNGLRKSLSGQEVDLFELDFGRYIVTNAINSPNESRKKDLCMVDVNINLDGRKEIYVTYSYDGVSYYTSFHTKGATTNFAGGKWMVVSHGFITEPKTTNIPTSIVDSGFVSYHKLDYYNFSIVNVTVCVRGLKSTSEMNKTWLTDVVEAGSRPVAPKIIELYSETNPNSKFNVQLTRSGNINCYSAIPTTYLNDRYIGTTTFLAINFDHRPPTNWNIAYKDIYNLIETI